MNVRNWKIVVQIRDSWKKIVEQARILYMLWRFIRRRRSPLCFKLFVRISEQAAAFALYVNNWMVFITEMKSVYSAVRTGYLNKAVCASSVKG